VDELAVLTLTRGTYRATITGVGRPGPIEERLGRRLIRLVDPESKEGSALLRSGRVAFVGPGGEALECQGLSDARRLLRARLLNRIARCGGADGSDALQDGLVRLRGSAPRTSRV
jgi:hypothetical protein